MPQVVGGDESVLLGVFVTQILVREWVRKLALGASLRVVSSLGMISVHIMYPKTDDSTFDMDYYCATHMPMLANALGDACVHWGAATPDGGDWAGIGWAVVTDRSSSSASTSAVPAVSFLLFCMPSKIT